MRYYLLKTLRLSHFCATFWLNSVKIRKKHSKIFGTFAEMRYFCKRNQEQVQDFKRNDGTFRTSRLTTSIKVQIVGKVREIELFKHQRKCNPVSETVKEQKTKKSQTLITQDVKTLVVLD